MNANSSDNVQSVQTASSAQDYATAGHDEYLAEAKQLVDEQIEVLFAALTADIARAADEAGSARQAAVTRGDHTLTVRDSTGTGTRAAVFTVEAITDLPEGADRAQAFPAGQARCIMQAPDGSTAEWVLHRVGSGDSMPLYAWMAAGKETPMDDAQIITALRPLFAGSSAATAGQPSSNA